MAIYTCTTQEGTLSAEQRAGIAQEITRIHSTHTGEPAGFVWVLFATLSTDSTFIGGKPAVNALMVGLFWGHPRHEVKTEGRDGLWGMEQNAPRLSGRQLAVVITD